MYLYSAETAEEDPRTTVRRRLQQQKCLVCGARQLALGHGYFCIHCKPDWRFCSTCEQLRAAIDHGKDSRCKGCASQKALAYYRANRDRTIYRHRLRDIARRTHTRGDQLLYQIRRRIWLADLVKRTLGMSWEARGRMTGADATYLAEMYRAQCRGLARDVDRIDRARDAYWSAR